MGFAPQRVIDFVNTRFVLVEKEYIELTINAKNAIEDINNEEDYEYINN
jgi:hypothetical protein